MIHLIFVRFLTCFYKEHLSLRQLSELEMKDEITAVESAAAVLHLWWRLTALLCPWQEVSLQLVSCFKRGGSEGSGWCVVTWSLKHEWNLLPCLTAACLCFWTVAAIFTGLNLVDSTHGWLMSVMGAFLGWDVLFYFLFEVKIRWKMNSAGTFQQLGSFIFIYKAQYRKENVPHWASGTFSIFLEVFLHWLLRLYCFVPNNAVGTNSQTKNEKVYTSQYLKLPQCFAL